MWLTVVHVHILCITSYSHRTEQKYNKYYAHNYIRVMNTILGGEPNSNYYIRGWDIQKALCQYT